MKRSSLFVITSLVFLVMVACSGSGSAQENGDHEHMDEMEHSHVEAPEEFASLENPVAGDHEANEAGEAIFQANCATCHGPEGRGDGPGSEGLDPKPAALADGDMMNTLSDGYLFWRVSKGGQLEPFNSAMPAWEESLSEVERWQVITFLRKLGEESDGHMDNEEHMDEVESVHEDEHHDEHENTQDHEHSD